MILVKGIGSSPYIGVGEVKIVDSSDFTDLDGKIVVVSRASRDIVSYLHNVAGVITDYGGITSHVAIVLREMGIACVVGTENGTQVLEDDMVVTVDGNTGNIYMGFMEIENKTDNLFEIYNPATQIKVNLNISKLAEKVAPYADGVGSIRIENMVLSTGKHPKKLLNEDRLTDIIIEEVKTILDAFYPKPVWFRTFDIPTDELKYLDGGNKEVVEKNPLLGLRGINKDICDVNLMKAELNAVVNLLDSGYDNLAIKIPFIRDVSQYLAALNIMKEVGIKPHKDLDVGVSIETPSTVFMLDEFIDIGIDFVSIGMSDITMCALAVDRRSVKVAKHFSLLHPAVLKMVRFIIDKCNVKDIESCICGYAASNIQIIDKLMDYGINSISTNPDQLFKIRKFVERKENNIILNSNY